MFTVAQEQLKRARLSDSGRSSATVYKGPALSQTVVALTAGVELSEHENPGEATAQILVGRLQLRSGHDVWECAAGNLVVIPPARHSLKAVEDCAFLLTVART